MYYFNYEEPVFRPPSESRSLILQITIGCSQNSCRFCGMYKMKKFRLRSLEDIENDIDAIPESHRAHYRRIFLADGDALTYPHDDLVHILDLLDASFPNLSRIGIYASPRSLTTKSCEQLEQLKAKKLRILYFGLESGDGDTLAMVKKGFSPTEMLEQCLKAKSAGMKLSVTAILGLAGRKRSHEHAMATAEWINQLSPEYFSLLTMFKRHNDDYFDLIQPLTNGGIIEEALMIVTQLNPQRTILRSNHVSNVLNLAGSYPKDRERIIVQAESALDEARCHVEWFRQIPDYGEEYY
jgi:radical SAM superfamily enzyme YgiQ (UPF0313 family)